MRPPARSPHNNRRGCCGQKPPLPDIAVVVAGSEVVARIPCPVQAAACRALPLRLSRRRRPAQARSAQPRILGGVDHRMIAAPFEGRPGPSGACQQAPGRPSHQGAPRRSRAPHYGAPGVRATKTNDQPAAWPRSDSRSRRRTRRTVVSQACRAIRNERRVTRRNRPLAIGGETLGVVVPIKWPTGNGDQP